MLSRILIILLVATTTSASAIEKTWSLNYTLGDSESKTMARKAVITSIKRAAADDAGVYIQSEKNIDNGDLSEKIKIISASIVKINVLEERVSTTSTGDIQLFVRASTDVDESILRSRIEQIKANKDKDQKISTLLRERAALIKTLHKLDGELRVKAVDSSKADKLLSQKDKVMDSLNEQSLAIENVFEKGMLVAIAQELSFSKERVFKSYAAWYDDFIVRVNTSLEFNVKSVTKKTIPVKRKNYRGDWVLVEGESQDVYDLVLEIPNEELFNEWATELYDSVIPGFSPKAAGKGISPRDVWSLTGNDQKKTVMAKLHYINENPLIFRISVGNYIADLAYFGITPTYKGAMSKTNWEYIVFDKNDPDNSFSNADHQLEVINGSTKNYSKVSMTQEGGIQIKLQISSEAAEEASRIEVELMKSDYWNRGFASTVNAYEMGKNKYSTSYNYGF